MSAIEECAVVAQEAKRLPDPRDASTCAPTGLHSVQFLRTPQLPREMGVDNRDLLTAGDGYHISEGSGYIEIARGGVTVRVPFIEFRWWQL